MISVAGEQDIKSIQEDIERALKKKGLDLFSNTSLIVQQYADDGIRVTFIMDVGKRNVKTLWSHTWDGEQLRSIKSKRSFIYGIVGIINLKIMEERGLDSKKDEGVIIKGKGKTSKRKSRPSKMSKM